MVIIGPWTSIVMRKVSGRAVMRVIGEGIGGGMIGMTTGGWIDVMMGTGEAQRETSRTGIGRSTAEMEIKTTGGIMVSLVRRVGMIVIGKGSQSPATVRRERGPGILLSKRGRIKRLSIGKIAEGGVDPKAQMTIQDRRQTLPAPRLHRHQVLGE